MERMTSRRIGLNPLQTTNLNHQSALFSSSSQSPTTSAATSRSTSPTPSTSHHPQSGANGGIGEYCQSPDSFYPISAPRRRDTSTVIGMNSNSNGGATPPPPSKDSNLLARRHSPASSSSPQASSLPRHEIPFIGGGFSQSQQQRSTPAKRGSMSNNNHGLNYYFGRGKRARCTKLFGLLVGVGVVWWVTMSWRGEREPRRKLTHRWWEEQEDSLSPGKNSLPSLLPISQSR